MRIIAGSLSGVGLLLSSDEMLKPTTDRVKESVFNILQLYVRNSIFLDLFAGTGQIGIEALSRGAKEVIFVENNRRNIRILNRNIDRIRNLNSDLNMSFFYIDAFDFLSKFKKNIDIAFLDPPYKSNILNDIMFKLVKIMSENGIILTESLIKLSPILKVKSFDLVKRYKYGRIAIDLYNRGGSSVC